MLGGTLEQRRLLACRRVIMRLLKANASLLVFGNLKALKSLFWITPSYNEEATNSAVGSC